MVRKAFDCAIVAFLILTFNSVSHAALVLSLSSPNGLSSLRVGDTITIEASLTGLNAGEELDSLTATTSLVPSIFAKPNPPVAGPIIPNASDFIPVISVGIADGAFFMSAGPNGIVSNGVFYSFSVKVLGHGSGVIVLDSGSLSAEFVGQAAPVFPTAAGGLAYNVVPEPTTAVIMSCFAVTAFVFPRRRGCLH